MDIEDLLASTDIGQGHNHLTVEAARTQQGGIKHIGPVGRGDHNNALVGLKAIHLNEHLVERLFALVITATQASTTLPTDRINLVDEDNARRLFFGVFKHVADTGCAHADKHFHEIRA